MEDLLKVRGTKSLRYEAPEHLELRHFRIGSAYARRRGVPSQADELAERARRFAVRVLKFVRTLPRDPSTVAVARQLADSAPAESANYRAARRARSRAEFVAKMGTVAEEADESEHWLDVLRESGVGFGAEFDWLLGESRELRAIFVASAKTARANYRKPSNRSSNPQILKSRDP